MKNGFIVDKHGTKRRFKNGMLHCLNGPAVEYSNGEKCWWVNDEFLGFDDEGFWALWDRLTDEQRSDLNLLMHLPKF